MPKLIFQNFVPASVEQVWEHVTACSASGRIDRRALREKYGQLIAQDGDAYFQPVEGGTWWTIEWVTKAGGLRAYTLWLGFQFRSKRRVFRQTVQPVLDQFQAESSGVESEA